MTAGGGFGAVLDLLLPAVCGGCGVPGISWCEDCAAELSDHPIRLSPRVDPGMPVWALGRYAGVRRHAVIEMKERGRRDLAGHLGSALAVALGRLGGWHELDTSAPLVLIPAPSRARAARRRGGDPVTRMAAAAVGDDRVCRALKLRLGARDSVGLSAAQRRTNLGGRVRITGRGHALAEAVGARPASVVFVDDVMTTGTTVTESTAALRNAGIEVSAALVVAGVG